MNHQVLSSAQPLVATDSPLHRTVSVHPAMVDALCEALLADIERCVANCTIGMPGTTQAQAFEQIHDLKNAIVVTGALQLLGQCEELRLASSALGPEDLPHGLGRRYVAVASAAAAMVKDYRRLQRVTLRPEEG